MHYIIALSCLLTLPTDVTSRDDDKLKPLNHYVGQWDSQFTIESSEGTSDGTKFKGSVTGKWVVGDQFLEQTGEYKIGNETLVIKTLMTFDTKSQKYRYWYFISSGQTRESMGVWDANAQTMTSTMQEPDNQNIVTIIANFTKQGFESWTIETKSKDGKLVSRIRGTNTRR